MDQSRLDEIRARCEAATPGPWKVDRRLDGVPTVFNEKERIFDAFKADGQSVLNAEFCAYARDDIPFLLAEVERLRAELEAAKAIATIDAEPVRHGYRVPGEDYVYENHAHDKKGWKNGSRECMKRLADYEDTGLTPDEIKALQDFERSQLAALLAENGRVERTLDAAMRDLHGVCKACLYKSNDPYDLSGSCYDCSKKNSKWHWRGLCTENRGAP